MPKAAVGLRQGRSGSTGPVDPRAIERDPIMATKNIRRKAANRSQSRPSITLSVLSYPATLQLSDVYVTGTFPRRSKIWKWSRCKL